MGAGVILDLFDRTKDELSNLMDEHWYIRSTNWSAKIVILSLAGDKLSTPGYPFKSTGLLLELQPNWRSN